MNSLVLVVVQTALRSAHCFLMEIIKQNLRTGRM